MFDLLFLNACFESEFPIFNLELLLVGFLGLNLSHSYFDRVSLLIRIPGRNCLFHDFGTLDLEPAGIAPHLLHLIVSDLDQLRQPLLFHYCYCCWLHSFLLPLLPVSILTFILLVFFFIISSMLFFNASLSLLKKFCFQ